MHLGFNFGAQRGFVLCRGGGQEIAATNNLVTVTVFRKRNRTPHKEVQQDDLSKRQEFGERTSCRTPCCSRALLPNLDPFSEGILPNSPNCRT